MTRDRLTFATLLVLWPAAQALWLWRIGTMLLG